MMLIAAHGNNLRALVKNLEDIQDKQIVDINIPTCVPLVEEFDDDLNSIRHYYLGDPARIREATQAAASTGKSR